MTYNILIPLTWVLRLRGLGIKNEVHVDMHIHFLYGVTSVHNSFALYGEFILIHLKKSIIIIL